MDKEEKLSQLVQESKLIFLNEERKNLNRMMIILLNCRLNKGDEEVREFERFFHSLKGTSSTLQFHELSAIGKEYEDYLSTVNKSKGLSERFFLKVLDGLALVHESLEKLDLGNDNPKEKDHETEKFHSNTTTEENDMVLDSNAGIGEPVGDEPKYVSGNKKTILLVDDVGVIVHLMEAHLSSLNYEVISAKDGEEGIRKCKTIKPDLMLLDLMLPKVDGFEVCRVIKNDPETKNTKIIAVSSKNKKEDVLKCFKAGIDDYLVKPFSMKELEQRVKKLL